MPSKPASADTVIAWLREQGMQATREGMARYAIPADKALGVTVGQLRQYAKTLRRSHDLAAELWATDIYEARMLATMLDEPVRVMPVQMQAWAEDFDSWAICDTACFNLFDHSPHAWAMPAIWVAEEREFVKRAGFALLWSLSVHDKKAGDEAFLQGLQLIAANAADDRNFVKKAVNMALRAIGKRNRTLNLAAVTVAQKLAASKQATERWVGKDALRELSSAAVIERLRK